MILTYGGRIGINLGYALPCFACPYVAGCGGYCFLMFLQRVGIFGIAAYDRIFTYIGLQNLLWFLIFAVSAIILSKFWCGWICPFGSLLDALSGLRKKMGIRGNRIFVDCADNDKTDKIYFFSSDFSSSAFDCFF
ncbi:MAG: 4Fe-4S binding protein [Phascolarctobacterium faecium]|uniref:4Fe-4S binding protein n=1 Tax=Phascolarctobacterium faecium TaxID=33025 RepID=UPI00399BFE89